MALQQPVHEILNDMFPSELSKLLDHFSLDPLQKHTDFLAIYGKLQPHLSQVYFLMVLAILSLVVLLACFSFFISSACSKAPNYTLRSFRR